MLPSVVSRQVADSVAAFLRAAFPLNSPLFNGEENNNVSMLEQFLAQPETLLKGPYLSAQLPFRKSDLPLNFFPNLTLPFRRTRIRPGHFSVWEATRHSRRWSLPVPAPVKQNVLCSRCSTTARARHKPGLKRLSSTR